MLLRPHSLIKRYSIISDTFFYFLPLYAILFFNLFLDTTIAVFVRVYKQGNGLHIVVSLLKTKFYFQKNSGTNNRIASSSGKLTFSRSLSVGSLFEVAIGTPFFTA